MKSQKFSASMKNRYTQFYRRLLLAVTTGVLDNHFRIVLDSLLKCDNSLKVALWVVTAQTLQDFISRSGEISQDPVPVGEVADYSTLYQALLLPLRVASAERYSQLQAESVKQACMPTWESLYSCFYRRAILHDQDPNHCVEGLCKLIWDTPGIFNYSLEEWSALPVLVSCVSVIVEALELNMKGSTSKPILSLLKLLSRLLDTLQDMLSSEPSCFDLMEEYLMSLLLCCSTLFHRVGSSHVLAVALNLSGSLSHCVRIRRSSKNFQSKVFLCFLL